jgi:hypothetical protein
MTNLQSGESVLDIVQKDLERTVSCSQKTSTITATLSAAVTADTFFISNTNADKATLRVYDSSNTLSVTLSNVPLGKWNNKLLFPTTQVKKITLDLSATQNNLYAGLLFLDSGAVLPRFIVGVDMSDELNGEGYRSDYGQAHGMEGTMLETISLQWNRITNNARNAMRRYINDVQLYVPHYISPYDTIDMYVTINQAGKWKKHDGKGFYWDTSIAYKGAR